MSYKRQSFLCVNYLTHLRKKLTKHNFSTNEQYKLVLTLDFKIDTWATRTCYCLYSTISSWTLRLWALWPTTLSGNPALIALPCCVTQMLYHNQFFCNWLLSLHVLACVLPGVRGILVPDGFRTTCRSQGLALPAPSPCSLSMIQTSSFLSSQSI